MNNPRNGGYGRNNGYGNNNNNNYPENYYAHEGQSAGHHQVYNSHNYNRQLGHPGNQNYVSYNMNSRTNTQHSQHFQFDMRTQPPPHSLTAIPPPQVGFPTTWFPQPIIDSETRFHSGWAGSDDSRNPLITSTSTASAPSPRPKSPASLGGNGDGPEPGQMTNSNNSANSNSDSSLSLQPNCQPRVDPDQLVESFKVLENITVTPELVAPEDCRWGPLSQAIWKKYVANQQTAESFRKKMELWRDIFDLIRQAFPTYGLQVVGSTMSGFGTNTSDVDMCLLIQRTDVDQRTEAVDCLHSLWTLLHEVPYLDKTEVIYAKVPILTFRDSFRDLEVDLNCNNCVGIQNTHLMHCYAQQDWRVRPLVLVVKMWARFQGINDAKNMSLSSYSLVLMVINFLQHGVTPAILPCIQQYFTDKESDLVDFGKFSWPYHETMEPCFNPPEPVESTNLQTLGDLLVNFLQYFAVKFDYVSTAVSVRTGGLLSIESCMNNPARKNDANQWKFVCVEEPFEHTNTARSVYDRDAFDRIRGVFFASWQRLLISKALESIFVPVQATEARNIGARLRANVGVSVYSKARE